MALNEKNVPEYFKSLQELDRALDQNKIVATGALKFVPRRASSESSGKLLVCHDYKGGYQDKSDDLCYTFNFWPYCDTFVYFSHHRVSPPPPAWVTAAHRQGSKILGTLIFERSGEDNCLLLTLGPTPETNTAGSSTVSAADFATCFPTSPHYAHALARLAQIQSFDGYLLNIECPLRGSYPQVLSMLSWISLLRSSLRALVGSHAEVIWYDSVTIIGQLAWQDRLNGYNLAWFLASDGLFTNYRWDPSYPSLTAAYFSNISPSLLTEHVNPHPEQAKNRTSIYFGIDMWGRGSHGGGGFGAHKAQAYIHPQGFSTALFAPGWSWEHRENHLQERGGWWREWWELERALWVGNERFVVDSLLVQGEASGKEGGQDPRPTIPSKPLSTYLTRRAPPDPLLLPISISFSPGVGEAWFVGGKKVHEGKWTDVSVQTSIGDLVWPKPKVELLRSGDEGTPELIVEPELEMRHGWSGGNSLRMRISAVDPFSSRVTTGTPKTTVEEEKPKLWIPIQSANVPPGQTYSVAIIHKSEAIATGSNVAIAIRPFPGSEAPIEVTQNFYKTLQEGWVRTELKFTAELDDKEVKAGSDVQIGITVDISSVAQYSVNRLDILLGYLSVVPVPPDASDAILMKPYVKLLWARFHPTQQSTPRNDEGSGKYFQIGAAKIRGILSWAPTISLTALNPPAPIVPGAFLDGRHPIDKEDPIPRWILAQSLSTSISAGTTDGVGGCANIGGGTGESILWWNIWASVTDQRGQHGAQKWVGFVTNRTSVQIANLGVPKLALSSGGAGERTVRYYIQGFTEGGELMSPGHCTFAEYTFIVPS